MLLWKVRYSLQVVKALDPNSQNRSKYGQLIDDNKEMRLKA
jgi:hypothetical protein